MNARGTPGAGSPPVKAWHSLVIGWGVVTVALAAPAFQLLDANRLFLAISRFDLVFFVFAFQVVPTAVVFGVDRLVAWRASPGSRMEAARAVFWRLLLATVLASLILEARLLIVNQWELDVPIALSATVFVAVVILSIWLAWKAFREIQTWVAYLVLPATVLAAVPLWGLAESSGEADSAGGVEDGPSRAEMDESIRGIFFVILDGLNYDVMTENDLIDPETFPNLRALAGDGLWFTDATTNSESTEQSIPIMLTSAIPSYSVREETGLPIQDFESRNLLRFLDSGPGITVYQNFFNDCFVETFRKCDLGSSKNPWDRVPGTDAWDRLPGITTLVFERRLGTSGEWLVDELEARGLMPIQPGLFERPQKIPSLIADLESQESSEIEGGVYYVHSPLPHPPYVYDASGRLVNHANIEWQEGGGFAATYENYRAQSAFVDKRIGELIATLKDRGVYDDAVIVLTSDHGVRPWLDRMTDLQAKVPLIIKVPGVAPAVIETEYQHIDLLPTVLDLLGMEAPDNTEGRSALSPGAATSPRSKLIYKWSKPIYEYVPGSGEWRSVAP